MAEVLRQEFGVAVRWVESRARDTADNAAFAAAVFRDNNIGAALLVTHDFHMQRALRACSANALQCVGAPVASYSPISDSWIEELPNSGALHQSSLALHELLGLFAQRVR